VEREATREKRREKDEEGFFAAYTECSSIHGIYKKTRIRGRTCGNKR
jgi:hypothetical protein